MTWGLAVQVIVAGLATGALYGLVGLGYTLIFKMSGVLNFAHGDLINLSIFALLFALGGGEAVALVGQPWFSLLGGAVTGIAMAVMAAILLDWFAVGPYLQRGSTIGWVAATAAAGLLIRAIIGVRFSAESYSVPALLPTANIGHEGVIDLPGGGVIQVAFIAIVVIALVLAVTFDLWLRRSRTGRAMRAVSDDPEAGRIVGISPARVQVVAWIIAGMLAATAGLLIAPLRPVTLDLGVLLGLKGTAAAVLGGLGSARGALVAGIGIGLFEEIVTSLFVPAFRLGAIHIGQFGPAPSLHDVGPIAILVLLLVLLPGRLGGPARQVD